MFNILFTSVGRRVELVRAFRKAYAALNLEGAIFAVDIDPLAPALQEVDDAYLLPRVDDPSYPEALRRVCEKERVNLVFPLIDPDIPVLARNQDLLATSGAQVVVIPSESADIIGDKWSTYQFFLRHSVPTPRTWLADIDEPPAPYPLFLKPRRGSAAKDTFKVSGQQELEYLMKTVPDSVVQEYVGGPEITTDVLCDLDGEVLAVVSRERIEVRTGEVAKGRTIHDPVIQEHCAQVARTLKAVGPITVQCLIGETGPLFTEINARFAGGAPLAIAAGADLPRWFLAKATGIDPEIPPLGTYRTDLYMTRFDDSFLLTAEDLRNAARRGI
jgi:carbamoyl-phosphate synthase large subunit